MFVLPWHIFDALVDGLNITLPDDAQVIDATPAGEGEPWRRLAQLYEPVAAAVAAATTPQLVLSGDCITPLAALAGVQRRHIDPALVWFDAHGDFHTEQSTTSGYLGGLPLAKAVGRGDMTLPAALGLTPLAEERVLLVDARDLDPGEVAALATSSVRRSTVQRAVHALPEARCTCTSARMCSTLRCFPVFVFLPTADPTSLRCPMQFGRSPAHANWLA